jgi:Uma2 family endonuclease
MTLNLDSLSSPISLRPAVTLSDAELMRFSAENSSYKIERTREGDITIMTPVGAIGSNHEGRVFAALIQWTEASGTGIAFPSSAGFNLPDGSCLSPDACWLPLDRWNSLTPQQQSGFPPLCPDFIIEVRSRTDARKAVEAKMQLWIENGAQLAWLVDPVDNNVAIYKPHCEPEILHRPDAVQASAPVAGFELACRRLWSQA